MHTISKCKASRSGVHVVLILAAICCLMCSVTVFALDNAQIMQKIGVFEKGMSSRNVALVMQGIKPDAVWQGVMTHPNVEDNITKIFQLYPTINLARRRLELVAVEDRIASCADYRLNAVTTGGEPVELDTTFIFLWEKQGDDWWIIATNRPVLIPLEGSIEDDLKMIDPGGGLGPTDAPADVPATGAAPLDYDQAVARLCAPDEDFVRSLYQCVLHREPGEQAIRAQVERLRGGVPRQHMIAYLFASPEYVNRKHDSVRFMTDACQAVYGRQPTAAELKAWPRTDRKTIISEMLKNPAHLAAIRSCTDLWRKAPAAPAGLPARDKEVHPPSAAQQKAYDQFMAAHNALSRLMAAGKGGTPEGQEAYRAMIKAKEAYEATLK